jgi:hypothetical protein
VAHKASATPARIELQSPMRDDPHRMTEMTPIAAKPTLLPWARLKSYASELTRIKNRRSILPVHFRSGASWTPNHFLGTANIWSIMDLTDLRQNKVQRYLPTSEINIALWPTHRAVKAYL